MECRETELAFRFDAEQSQHAEIGRRLRGEVEQRGLAHTRFTPEHERGAQTVSRRADGSLHRSALCRPSDERHAGTLTPVSKGSPSPGARFRFTFT